VNGRKIKGCEESEKMGSGWVHFQLCLSCGHVEAAVILLSHKYGIKHFKATGHPVIKSYEPGRIEKGIMLPDNSGNSRDN
jgi:hypothetical protein